MYYIISILLGILPEILYFYLFLIFTKDIKNHKIKLLILLSLSYFLCMFINRYKVLYYIIFSILIYLSLKILYKQQTQIIDLFVFNISEIYITLLSLLIYIPQNLNQYFMCLIINRLMLFIPFVFKNKLNLIYKSYLKYWNRNDSIKRPIKSITLRNISLILINSIIFIINIICLYIIDLIEK